MSAKELPFAGIKVLDLTHARAGPTSVRLLSDWGADTIKIEQPEATSTDKGSILGARTGFDLQNLHRNKKSFSYCDVGSVNRNPCVPPGYCLYRCWLLRVAQS